MEVATALAPVPVTLGSPNHRELAIDGGTAIRAWFPPGTEIELHTHAYPIFAVMLNGAFDLRLTGRKVLCPPTSVIVEPAGEPHGNRVHAAGASVLVLQPELAEAWEPFEPLLRDVRVLQHAGIAAIASGIAHELEHPDQFSALSAEAAAVEMLVVAGRLPSSDRSLEPPPAWLARVVEMLHELPPESLRIRDLAREVDVHPVRLGRVFRKHYHMTMGKYARRIRVHWAADRLIHSNDSIAVIARQAGFADQSHLTRLVKRTFGLTPRQFRLWNRHARSNPEDAQ